MSTIGGVALGEVPGRKRACASVPSDRDGDPRCRIGHSMKRSTAEKAAAVARTNMLMRRARGGGGDVSNSATLYAWSRYRAR